MKKYSTPDFEITAFDAEDVLTISVGTGPVEGGEGGWLDI